MDYLNPPPKVGLLPLDNLGELVMKHLHTWTKSKLFSIEQVSFAYNMYKRKGDKNMNLAAQFKETFSISVNIDFLGCW